MSIQEIEATQSEKFSIIDEKGQVRPGMENLVPELSEKDLKSLYRNMVFCRILDQRMLTLQRQGRLGFYLSSLGEEATYTGSAFALKDTDWILPCYREAGAAFLRGYSLKKFINQCYGNAEDTTQGRQMPIHISAREVHYGSVSSPVGTQITQAAGVAWAAKIRKEDTVSLVYFGDGATSQGDFHVGLNFAGVFKLPVIFFCRNNGYAISVPRNRQTASETIGQKAKAYGIDGIIVDGNDLLAIIHVTREAVARARRGEGATLIEAVTYRLGAHSSSDDPNVYRDPDESKSWEFQDPISRFRNYLMDKGIWDDARDKEQIETLTKDILETIASVEKIPAPPLESLFRDVYRDLPWHLEEQARELLTYRQK